MAKAKRSPWEWVLLSYAWGVFVLWIVSTVLDSLPDKYHITPPNVTPIMAIVSGGLFAGNALIRFIRVRDNGNGEKNGS